MSQKTKMKSESQNQKTDEILSVLREIRDLLDTRLKKPLDLSELFKK